MNKLSVILFIVVIVLAVLCLVMAGCASPQYTILPYPYNKTQEDFKRERLLEEQVRLQKEQLRIQQEQLRIQQEQLRIQQEQLSNK